ncbi:MAG: NAD(P)/FAD-dependent oxidoreductase [Pseudanabaenaceae cyanobacterium]
MIRIGIVGGGFGGLYTALHLSRLPWRQRPEIALLERNDRFVFSPLLYEVVTGELPEWEVAPEYMDLLQGTNVLFVQGEVTAVETDSQHLRLADGRRLHWDYLVLATGCETPLAGVPGAREYALPFRTLADARRLHQKLTELEQSPREKIRVCIVGGGASGIELACKLADRLGERGRVRILDRNRSLLMRGLSANREAAVKALDQRNVWRDLGTQAIEVRPDEIVLDYGQGTDTLPTDLVLWTVGNRAPQLLQDLDLPKKGDRLHIQPTLQVREHPHIFALGDGAAGTDDTGQPLPATAQVAIQQAQYCAWNLWSAIAGRPLVDFRYVPLGEFLSLGKGTASLATWGNLHGAGSWANAVRRGAYLLRMPTLTHRARMGWHWLTTLGSP